ncbi:hypothetical protein RHECNPAF_1330023 [Rhizobium etli CNPAF512]|nr:hypothetical protein RHECNPAF_1330023 [Rhizobium etli CNPAF512]
MEALNRSNFLFLRSSGWKTASHFSWKGSTSYRRYGGMSASIMPISSPVRSVKGVRTGPASKP